MKILFDAAQPYQLEAINAVVNVFAGQPRADGNQTRLDSPFDVGGLWSETGIGNALKLSEIALLENLRAVQTASDLHPSAELARIGQDDASEAFPNFSIEMETGTGKTYVYLRTAFELHAKYGFSKFIVVVPSVAIREGVISSLSLMAEHFRSLYGNVAFESWVYDSKQVSRVRAFAMSNTLQFMVLNIDAFNKSANVINKENDRLSGLKPLEFIQATHPIVIMDEPQNMESDQAKAAIVSLNPLCTLRYSATHRNAYDLLYKLDPVRAYDLKLVKRIEVDSVLDQPGFNQAYVALKSITATKTRITAKIEIDVNGKDGPRRTEIKLQSPSHQADLFTLSKGRDAYRGWIVDNLSFENKCISFTNGVEVNAGDATGARQDDVMRVQVLETVREHFEKELAIAKTLPEGKRLKVLSLFFIDRVAHYVEPDGKIRQWFIEAYQQIAALPKYQSLTPLPVEKVHNGYFATVKGVAKDSRGDTLADDEAYELIMRAKERLLSLDEPLRFIFSHSALREGWDNPNVFQICTLNETKSEIKKRQEIGRGLRLPVMENGERCRDERINRLTVIANESYTDFAAKLQTEIESECGVSFAGRIANKKTRKKIGLRTGWKLNEDFQEIWKRIQHKTRYSVAFDTGALIEKSAKRLAESEKLVAPRIAVQKAALAITAQGAETQLLSARQDEAEYRVYSVPDLIGYIQRATELTRSTIAQILMQSGRLEDVTVNPQQFLDQALAAVKLELRATMIDGIKYERIEGAVYDQMLFESEELYGYLTDSIPVEKSIFEETVFDSNLEHDFAQAMEARTDVKLCVKLPPWFIVKTPVGTYNPDWAVVMEREQKIYLVRETKGADNIESLAADERDKVKCGAKHFSTLGVDFKVVKSATDLKV
ncbi:MAG: DEAD/DEAH box helicase family protein [Rhodocyclaceae bacterium]|nr:DEAD/DEAH box helicase family protein [Rhodocyclaceae bacterium]